MSKSRSHTLYAFVLSFNLILTTVTAQQKPEEKIDVIRISTELVQTHVTVLDKKGHVVTGLRPDQFELQVDGKAQSLSFFEEVTAGGQLDRPVATIDPAKRSTPEKDAVVQRRTVFFFLDDLHLSPSSMKRTQDALQRFVTEAMGNSDQVAITTASAQLGFLQQLTNDKSVLRQAIERLKPRAVDYSDMQAPAMTEYQAWAIEQNHTDVKELFIERTCSEVLHVGAMACTGAGMSNNAVLDEVNTRSDKRGSSGGSSTGSNRTGTNAAAAGNQARWRAESMVKSRARGITRQSAQGILGTLSSLESLIRTAANLPERKLVVFVSDGFFINFGSSTQVYDLKRITDFATRYGTVIYTIDARGLNSGSDAGKSGSFDLSGRTARINLQEIRAGQQPLFNLAAETGGESWLNSNNIGAGIDKALSETSRYYLLAWRPENQAQTNDSFRRVKITIKDQPDLVVRVAGGFFSRAPEATNNSAAGASVDDQLIATLRTSYPKPDFPIIISAGYLSSANEGLVVATSVQVATDMDVDLMGAVVDDKGTILSSLKQQVTASSGTGNNSLITTLQFPKLPPSLVQVRIAARDRKSGRIGSAMQWLDLRDLSPNKFSVSSIFLSESAPASQGSAPKWIIKPDRKFVRTGRLKFQVFVYNADSSAGAPVVHLQLELRREGQVLVQTPASPIETKGVTDPGRIPVVGDFPLDGFTPGRHLLKLIFTDQKTKSAVSREAEFSIL
ncbi:MAG TPA: VWA domain-containing protein [Pyrinomonadaceae bacterium]|nr:VWA domain-containing protein [Pyrinomonadaceae bacterium]